MTVPQSSSPFFKVQASCPIIGITLGNIATRSLQLHSSKRKHSVFASDSGGGFNTHLVSRRHICRCSLFVTLPQEAFPRNLTVNSLAFSLQHEFQLLIAAFGWHNLNNKLDYIIISNFLPKPPAAAS